MVATKCERRRGHYPEIDYLTSFHSLCKYCFGGVRSLLCLLIWSLIAGLRYSVNSRRSLAESSRDSDDFGTFGLSGQHKISQRQRMPVRMEIFDAPRSDTEGSDFHLKVPSTGAELDGIQVISMAVWLYGWLPLHVHETVSLNISLILSVRSIVQKPCVVLQLCKDIDYESDHLCNSACSVSLLLAFNRERSSSPLHGRS